MKYVELLQSHEIRPILVFNGQPLPGLKTNKSDSKCSQEKIFSQYSENSYSFLQWKNIDVTPDMAMALIKKCHEIKVDCIVAPYEAAAQLAFFNLRGKLII